MTIKKGFTLVELLVVIAIIAILSTLAVVALNSARQKSRDAKRVSDIKQVQTALELYYGDQSIYPTGSGVALGGASAKCLSSGSAWAATCSGTTYMGNVPSNPTPNGATYSYTSADGQTYSIIFALEGATGGLSSGTRTASPSGIQ